MHHIIRTTTLALLAGALAAGCSNDQSSPSAPTSLAFQKAGSGTPSFPGSGAFVKEVTNPYLSFKKGRVFRYESETPEGLETTIDEVTNLHKTVMGSIEVTVVHDQVFLKDDLVEDTFDWYAQDEDGNVWYFGEDTKTLDHGVVQTTFGSWEAGITGSPGLVMLANPVRGAQYQQEDAPGIAEDMARVKSLDASVVVGYGPFDGCVQTTEWTPLEPGVREYKFYKAGVGLVLETGKGGERVELVGIE